MEQGHGDGIDAGATMTRQHSWWRVGIIHGQDQNATAHTNPHRSVDQTHAKDGGGHVDGLDDLQRDQLPDDDVAGHIGRPQLRSGLQEEDGFDHVDVRRRVHQLGIALQVHPVKGAIATTQESAHGGTVRDGVDAIRVVGQRIGLKEGAGMVVVDEQPRNGAITKPQ